jgi:long-chain acyl-CoA synthetase
VNLSAFVLHHGRYRPSAIAIESGGETITYGALARRIRQMTACLTDRGVKSGDIVGLRIKDRPEHIVVLIAILKIGGIILPLDWRATVEECERVLSRFPAAAVVDEGEFPPGSFAAIRPADANGYEPDESASAGIIDQPAVYSLTSGTTGAPKAIVLTHEEFFGRLTSFHAEGMILQSDRLLSPLPLAYSAGRVVALSALIFGATLVMFPSMFDAQELVRAVNQRAISALAVSPNVSRELLGLKSATRLMPDLRLYISTTGRLHAEERLAILDRVAPRLVDYYGSTGGGLIAIFQTEDRERAADAAGRPGFGAEVEVADEYGTALAANEVGWIRVRGAGVTTRFAGDAPAGDEGLRHGWYYPGDLGYLDASGYLYLTGRTADLIKRGGLMVHAQEVERVLASHDAVMEAAVVGLPSAELGETVGAFVRLQGEVTQRDLIAFCRARLAPYKIPASVTFVDALPRNANGKVVKAELVKRASKV